MKHTCINKQTDAVLGHKKVSSFWSPRTLPQTHASTFLIFFG